MSLKIGLVLDCADPQRVGTFWSKTLGYVEQPPPDGYESWEAHDAANGVSAEEAAAGYMIVDPDGGGPPLFLQRVPEPKVVKNRLHIDIRVSGDRGRPFEEKRGSIEAGIEPLLAEGATFLRRNDDPQDYFVVMQDPEGNEFCLV